MSGFINNMKQAEIHTKKEANKVIYKEAFVAAYKRKRNKFNTVYVSIGELYGKEILVSYKYKKTGRYLILE